MEQSAGVVSRREFVARAAGLAVGASLSLPAVGWARVPGANDRVRLGVIGTGSRGKQLLEHLAKMPDVEVAALCDVYPRRITEAAALVGGSPRAHADYRAMLDDPGIDGVLVVTPDHWHERMTADACRAGKDVFVEKPLTREIAEGERLVRVQRETGRVVQVGLQQRSGPHYRQARAEFFDTGRIGRIIQVRTTWHGIGVRTPQSTDRPEGLDWQRWLGPARARPFDADQFHNWRWYWDFGGGIITDLFTHWVDVVHWFTGEDHPVSVAAAGGNRVFPAVRPAPDTVSLLLEYPGGHTVTFDSSAVPSARGWSVDFYGTGGSLLIDRNQYTWTPAEKDAVPVVVKPEEEGTGPLLRNFLECMRTRAAPHSDVLSGHLSTRASILARQAYQRRRRIEPRGRSIA